MAWLLEPTLPIAVVLLIVGLGILSFAADTFVDGAVGIAVSARLSPVVVGAVIVGFGTSAPELVVSALAASQGNTNLGLGNIVGSNVANLSLVLAAAAFTVPVVCSRSVATREAPMSLAAVCLFALATLGRLSRPEGVILLIVLVAMLGWTILGGRQDTTDETAPADDGEHGTLWRWSLLTLGGLVGTIVGAQLLVTGAESIAAEVGLSGGFIGFALVALGTSVPELVTTFVAARKRQTDLILGNLLGSNMFNSLAVGGVVAIVGTGQMTNGSLRTVGVGAMVIVSIIAFMFVVTRRRLHRLEATVLLLLWLITLAFLAQSEA